MIGEKEDVQALIALVEDTPGKELEAVLGKRPGGVDGALDLVFELLASEFNPAKAKGGKGTFQFEITAKDETKLHWVHVENDACTVGRGQYDAPDITIGIKLPDMMLMGVGKLPGAKAFLTGKLKLRGSPLFGTKLGEWFDHPPV